MDFKNRDSLFKNREQVLHFMTRGEIRMSNQDAVFFQTIYGLIHRNKQLTSNQDQLFNKLLVKHKSQLKRKGLIASQLCEIPWDNVTIIDSKSDYTDPNIKLENGIIYLRTPYKKQFVSEFNTVANSTYIWNSGTRKYQSPFSTHALKIAINLVEKHFGKINTCPTVTEILQQVPKIDSKFWKPTLVKSNARYYIAASNHIINDLISNMELNDDPVTFFNLSKMGIDIDPELLGENKFAKFAANYYNDWTINSDEDISGSLTTLADWLHTLGVTNISVGKTSFTLRKYVGLIKNIFRDRFTIVNDADVERVEFDFFSHSRQTTKNVTKRIQLRDTKKIITK